MESSENKIEKAIFSLLDERGPHKTICPSEVARHLSPSEWRTLMPEIRRAADALKVQGRIKILQRGRPIASAQKAVGPIRLKATTSESQV